jgi:hypothetical protein
MVDGTILKGLLEEAGFGARVAEHELADLARYFVETDQWRRVYKGERDIVLGPKGAGKSALYSLVVQRAEDLLGRNIIVQPAENPEGAPVFQAVAGDPPTSEDEFEGLWKLYFLSLVAEVLLDWEVETDEAHEVYQALKAEGLLTRKATLAQRLQAVRAYVRQWFQPKSVETGLMLDPATGVPTGVTGKITLGEPTADESKEGLVSVDELLRRADHAMAQIDFTVWVVLDRLDVAFARHEQLETNALRALFAAYLDMVPLKRIRPKIFLRSDIWDRISSERFVEGSHIDEETIKWEPQGLMQLLLRRILQNPPIAEFYAVDPDEVFRSVQEQQHLIERIFPDQIDSGRHPKTFDWMLSRTQDGSRKTAPRELIHLLNSLRDRQLRMLELGHEPPPDEQLFHREAFKEALKDVSEARLMKTLYPEYPELKDDIDALRKEKSQQSAPTLSHIWGTDEEDARRRASRLVQVGFFEPRGTKEQPEYWVPFLYRDALELVQGEAKMG